MLVGETYDRLTVIAKTDKKDNNRAFYYLCQCTCGSTTLAVSSQLKSGHKRSCGCIKKELDSKKGKARKLDDYPSAFNKIYKSYKYNSRKRNHEFLLTKNELLSLVTANCYYCDDEPQNLSRDKGLDNEFRYNGVDRIDNNKGYFLENCVPCCFICNRAKMNLSTSDFYTMISKIHNNMKQKGIVI